jgi:hypothetical protein
MKRPKQTPYDRVLWSLVTLNGKAEWTELRIRTKLKESELDVILSELVKDGRVSIMPRETQEPNRAAILLKLGKARPWQG